MDSNIATGAAAIMACRVLLDHDVNEKNIVFLSLISAPEGLHSLSAAFPDIKIVTSAVDDGLDAGMCILPGMGDFGARFFGDDVE